MANNTPILGLDVNGKLATMGHNLGNAILMAGPLVVPAIRDLQTALGALGALVRNAALQVVADGINGPKTTAATNLALTKYVTGASAALRKGNLSQAQVSNQAAALAALVKSEIPKRQAAQIPVVANAVKAQTTVNAVKAQGGVTAQAAQRAAVTALQKALQTLGVKTNNATLKAIKADGLNGPKTLAATNLAFAKYVAVPAGMTLPVSAGQIDSNAAALAALIQAANTEANAKALAARVSAANAQNVANKLKSTATPAQAVALDRNVFKALQEGLNTLFALVKNKTRITADGIVGNATTSAVNLALKTYIKDASEEMRKGKLTINDVKNTGVALVSLVRNEIAKRKGDATSTQNAANAARESLPPAVVEKVQDTFEAAQQGDSEAQDEIKAVIEASQSPDPEIQKPASDAVAILREEAEAAAAPDEYEYDAIDTAWNDTNAERIDELYLIDDAELSDSELGAALALAGEMGWNPIKAAKKTVKGATKVATKTVKKAGSTVKKGAVLTAKGAKEGAKLAVKVTMLPFEIQAMIIRKYAVPIARGICAVPPVILHPLAVSQGINPAHLTLFCEAAKTGLTSDVKKYLPLALKIAVALAANGTLGPGATAALLAIKKIPGIGMVPGLKFLAGDLGCGCSGDLGCY